MITVQAKSLVELRAAIYKKEGWKRAAGESQNARIVAAYNIVSDPKANRLIATKRSEAELAAPRGPLTAWEKLIGEKI